MAKVIFRIPDDEFEQLARVANKNGMLLNEQAAAYVRRGLSQALRQRQHHHPPRVPEPAPAPP